MAASANTRSRSQPESYRPGMPFGRVTMYDGKTQLLIKNPINRYLINLPMLPNIKLGA